MAKSKKTGKTDTSTDPVTAYARAVNSGKIIAGPHVRNACARHLKDLKEGPKRGLSWNVDKANRAIGYFRDVLFVDIVAGDTTEGEMKPFELIDWQAFIVGSLFGWMGSDGFRRFRMAFIETGKGPLALDTPVATPDGWTTMGDIRVGDVVFDETGRPCNVTAVSPVFVDRDCYRLRFSDGCEIVADAAHEWRTAALRAGGKPGPKPAHLPRKGGYATRNTEEIARTLRIGPTTSDHPQAKWNHRVDVAGELDLPDVDLPVPPYTFGAWLSDGDSDCARLTLAYADWFIVHAIEREGVPVAEQKRHSKTTARVVFGGDRRQSARNNSVQSKFRALGVLGNKHIPGVYLRASARQRMELLRGLMDTDGTVYKNGSIELTLCCEPLVYGAIELMRSLGFKPTVSESDSFFCGRKVGRRWRIRIHAYRDAPVFKLPRKVERLKPRPATRPISQGRMIVACDPVPSVPVRCITVDSSSHLFLAGEGMIPTHNSGKSPLAAGIGMYMLTADGEFRAEIYAAAQKKDQAKVLFRDAVAMMEKSPALSERLHPSGGVEKTNIAYLEKGSFFRPISTEERGKGQSGPRPHCGLLDEIHEHSTNAMVEFMRAGTKGRNQALIFMITNSGSDRTSVCYDYHDYGAKVCEGSIEDDSMFAYICGLDDGDDPFKDESCWPKANPSLGVTITEKYLREQVVQARGMPSKQNLVLRLNFCVWTDAESTWIGKETWDACEVDPNPLILAGRKAYGGLDLSSKKDLSALALVFEPDADGFYDAFLNFWTPSDTIAERSEEDRVPYDVWQREGHIKGTPGKTVDYRHVAKDMAVLNAAHEIEEIGFDPHRIEYLIPELEEEGIDCWTPDPKDKDFVGKGIKLTPHQQGFISMGLAVDAAEEIILNGKLRVWVNPVLRWNMASTVLDEDPAGNRKPNKRKATGRIDGTVALIMALRLAALASETDGPSIYENDKFFM